MIKYYILLFLGIIIGSGFVFALSKTPKDMRVIKNLQYATYKNTPQLLDLYLPTNNKTHPLIVWVHGGAFKKGDRTWIRPTVLKQTKHEFAVASIEYTLSQDAKWPVQIYEIKAAIRWLRAHRKEYHLSNVFVVWGDSAGGYFANFIGTTGGMNVGLPQEKRALQGLSSTNASYSDKVQGVISWYGPTNFMAMTSDHLEKGSPESQFLGCTVRNCAKKVELANPIHYVSKNDPPFLLLHGNGDKTVDFNQSVLLYKALKKAHVKVKMLILEGYSHGDARFDEGKSVKAVEYFLDTLSAH